MLLRSCNVADLRIHFQCLTPKPSLYRRNTSVSLSCSSSSSSARPSDLAMSSVTDNRPVPTPTRSGRLDDRPRMGGLSEDGLSYKENFIVRCCEVGINKTATVETIANLMQRSLFEEEMILMFSHAVGQHPQL